MTKARLGVTVVALALAALFFSLATYTYSDDHFGRISPGRQIARYGELPFRDFFDPGYFLTEMSSAAVQRVFGDNLLGEMLLTSSFVAAGAVTVFLLARRATGSVPLACLTAVVTVLTFRRPYDYDKFLFYPWGLLASWRYAEWRRRSDLAATAAVAVVAGMFRYDNALFVIVSALVVIGVTHRHELSYLIRRGGLFAGACVLCALPYGVFLQANGSIREAVDQISTYAQREGARTRVATLPTGVLSEIHVTPLPPPQPHASWRRRLRRHIPVIGSVSISWSAAGASALAYYIFVAISIGATVTVLRVTAADGASERARVLSAVSVTLLAVALILREPVAARIGGMIGPPAVLAAWMWHRFARWRVVRGFVAACALLTLVVATEWQPGLSLMWRNGNPLTRLARAAATPPSTLLLPKPRLAGLVEYLRRCTRPEDRILTAWFAPELAFFSGRAFAGGMAETFGDHWSEADRQRRIVVKLTAQSVPVVLLREGDESFARGYPIVAEYVREHYRDAGSSAFGGTGGGNYTVLARVDRAVQGTDASTSMPCFGERRAQ